MSNIAMVFSKRMPEPMFFRSVQLAKDSVVMSCSKLKLDSLKQDGNRIVYTFRNAEDMIHEIVTVTEIIDSQIYDHVEHI